MGAHDFKQLPADHGVEIAIVGGSNCGKSSVINAISANSKLARVSKTPGRTRQINFFALDDTRRLVDLPGYGYAKVSGAMRKHWQSTINRYFRERRALAGLLLVMDIRHPMKPGDRLMLDWAQQVKLPTHVLLNKADKLSRNKRMAALGAFTSQNHDALLSAQLFSTLKNIGIEEARAVIDDWFGYD